MKGTTSIGIVGGSGALGGAIARALLHRQIIAPGSLWISNRSGSTAGFEQWPDVSITTSNQQLADACGVVLLAVPPDLAPTIGISAPGSLIISVMAGVTAERIGRLTGSRRVVRAMSSPAAEFSLAYSPWYVGGRLDDGDRETVSVIFDACGLSDEIDEEDQINRFTAMTGPVPGFVAFYADCMIDHAVKNGIPPAVADRAIRQLFRAGGTLLAESDLTPADHVGAMIDYAGTTAAGLLDMRSSGLARLIDQGLDAACNKARSLG